MRANVAWEYLNVSHKTMNITQKKQANPKLYPKNYVGVEPWKTCPRCPVPSLKSKCQSDVSPKTLWHPTRPTTDFTMAKIGQDRWSARLHKAPEAPSIAKTS